MPAKVSFSNPCARMRCDIPSCVFSSRNGQPGGNMAAIRWSQGCPTAPAGVVGAQLGVGKASSSARVAVHPCFRKRAVEMLGRTETHICEWLACPVAS